MNGIDPLGLAAGCDEECYQKCLNENYGSTYDWSRRLNPLAPVALGLNVAGDYVADKLAKEGTRNLYGNDQSFRKGQRQVKTWRQFRRFNIAGSLVGAGALGFWIGANTYCILQCR